MTARFRSPIGRLGECCRGLGRAVVVALGATGPLLPQAGLADLLPGRSMLPEVAQARELPARFVGAAAVFEAELVERVMPYWHDTTIDEEHGGYLLGDDVAGPVAPPATKMIVSQARMVWGFAHAHRNGVRDPERDYLAAAAQGYRFLIERFRDPEHGGYYWLTDRAGNPLDDGKFLYGQAFVIYALVEYYRASGQRSALEHAVELYRTVQAHAYDEHNGGWWEQAHADWRPLAPGEPSTIGIPGLKSGNAHLHWFEALTELFEVTRPHAIRTSFNAPLRLAKVLREALQINTIYFYRAVRRAARGIAPPTGAGSSSRTPRRSPTAIWSSSPG